MRLAPLIPALPLAGAAILLLSGKRWRGHAAGWFASLLVAVAFLVALVVFVDLIFQPSG